MSTEAMRLNAPAPGPQGVPEPAGWREFLLELISACESGDINEDCEHPDWKRIYVRAQSMLTAHGITRKESP